MKTKLLSITAAFALAMNAYAQIPTNGLVAYYQFNGNANDLSGNGNNGTVTSATLVADRNGNSNSAYSFNGTTSYIDILNSSSLNNFGSNAMTVVFWGKILSAPTSGYNGIIISKQSGSGLTQQGFDVAVNSTNNTYLRAGSSGGQYAGGGTGNATINVYHHYVLIYDNGTSTCYLDGALISSTPGSAATIGANTMNLLIGKANWSNVNAPNFNGILDELEIYNRGLTPTEVTQIYSGSCNTVDITTGLVGKYDFTGNANDNSGNGNNGTVNGATLTTDRFGNANSAYNFNGSSNYIDVLNNSSLNFSNNTSFTISSWIKLNGSNVNYSGIVTKMDNSGNGYQFVVGNTTALNKLATEFGQGGTGVSFVGNQNLNDGNWHNVIYVADRVANTISFYVDNVLDIQTTSANVSAANVDNTAHLKIGVDRTMVDYFKGTMDDIKIYNKALTTCDIDSLYTMPNLCVGITANISASGPLTFCQGGNVILTATAATSYLWTNNATTQSITVSTAGANSVTTINSNGCPATSATTTVTVNSKPTVLTTNPSAVCSPSTVNITLPAITVGSTGGLTYTYFTNAGATTPYLTPTTATSGTYYIVGATGNSCSDTTALTVTTNPKPTVVTVNPIAVCSPLTIDLTLPAITTGSTGGLTYTYYTNAGASTPYTTPTSATNGTYYIVGATGNSCSDTTAVIVTVNSSDITSGLVARYDFTGNANDLSGNSLNGTVTGAVLTSDRFGNANSAYSFNGTSNYIDVLDNSSLNFSNNSSFTISSWIKLNGSNVNYSGIVTKMDNSGNGYQFVVGNTTALNKLATEFGQGGTGVSFQGNQNLNDGNWHNVLYIVDRVANTISFYVDNVLDTQTTSANVSTANVDNTAHLKIGVDRTMVDYFKGTMDDIKIYNKALTTCDIDSLFNLPNPLSTKITESKIDLVSTIYPNPATSNIRIDGLAKGNFVELLDLTGRVILTTKESQIDISNFNNGLYFLRVFDTKENKVIKTFKLIKE